MLKIITHLPDFTHKLLESYLYNRTFAVRCNTTTSDAYITKAGVPQGSALGPTIFLLYTADIPTNEQLTTSTFADDTAMPRLRPSHITASKPPLRSREVAI